MARIASTVLVVLLLAATAAAFALTQGLKLQKSPIFGTDVQAVFSPVCGCDRSRARISFKLREADRIDVSIVGGGDSVRTLERGRSYPKGPVVIDQHGHNRFWIGSGNDHYLRLTDATALTTVLDGLLEVVPQG